MEAAISDHPFEFKPNELIRVLQTFVNSLDGEIDIKVDTASSIYQLVSVNPFSFVLHLLIVNFRLNSASLTPGELP